MDEAFERFIANYDLSDSDIRLKYNHSYRVRDLQVKYAKLLGYNDEDVEIAKLIGLLHDLGRFEQLKEFSTYNDFKSMDHAECSVKLLFKEGLIKDFCSREDWYPIIRFAIANHNKVFIAPCDDGRILRQARLIRDTDKLDILYLIGTLHELNMVPGDTKVSKEVKDSFKNHIPVDYDNVKTKNDRYSVKLAFPFDVNNDIVLEEMKRNLEPYASVLQGKEDLEEMYNEAMNYIDEKLMMNKGKKR